MKVLAVAENIAPFELIPSNGTAGFTVTPTATTGSGVQSVTAAVEDAGISVDNSDPANPVLFNTGVHDVAGGGLGVAIDNSDPRHPIISGTPVDSQTNVGTPGGTSNPFTFAQSTGATDRGSGFFVSATLSLVATDPADVVLVVLKNTANVQIGCTCRVIGSGSVTILATDQPAAPGLQTYTIEATNQTGGNNVTVQDGEIGFCFFAL